MNDTRLVTNRDGFTPIIFETTPELLVYKVILALEVVSQLSTTHCKSLIINMLFRCGFGHWLAAVNLEAVDGGSSP
jgi:hypothetical protein